MGFEFSHKDPVQELAVSILVMGVERIGRLLNHVVVLQ